MSNALRRILLVLIIVLLTTGVAVAGHDVSFGVDWSEQGTDALPAGRQFHCTLVFNGQIWVIGGTDSGGTESPKVYSSSDGITWAEVGTDVLPAGRSQMGCVVFDDQMWVVGGLDSGDARTETVYASSDGTTWAEVGTNALPFAVQDIGLISMDGFMWMLGGITGAGSESEKVYRTSDGATWAEVGTDALPVPWSAGSALVFNDRMWLLGGLSSSAVIDEVYSSPDGTTWVEAGTLPGLRRYMSAGVAEGNMWIMGGTDGTTAQETVFASITGEEWIEAGNNALPATIQLHSGAFFNGRMFTTGGNVGGSAASPKVFATDQVAGAVHPPSPDDTVSEFAENIPALDQSGDTASGNLPFIGEMAAEVETDTGWPVVDFVFTVVFGAVACGVGFFLARLAPDNKLVASIAVMVVVIIGFTIGQGLIEWYAVLAIGGLMFGLNSLGSAVQG